MGSVSGLFTADVSNKPCNVKESINPVLSVTTRKTSVLINENDVSKIKIVGAKTVKKIIKIIMQIRREV